jgi:F-type H+-transporting ATPase subunit gamma
MPNTREIKRRIKSVENTRQITRTMELVATSKLKRATDRVHATRPYSEALEEIVRSLYAPELADRFPLLRRPEREDRVAVLLLTADRGLAGAFNANLIKEARDQLETLESRGVEAELHVVGKKGIAYFRFQGREMASTVIEIGDRPTVEDAETLVGDLRDRFESGELDGVHVVASEFRSALSTPPRTRQVLPVPPPDEIRAMDNFILSPSGPFILERLLPAYVRNQVFIALVENAAAEQGSRRTAMKNATDNAGEMLDDLKRTYNRARQAQITQEIAEIVGGAQALE